MKPGDFANLTPMLMRFFILVALLATFTTAYPQVRKPKAVLIIIDGIPGDVIQKLQPPKLMEIAKHGGFALAYTGGDKGSYNETPTISAPGYNNIITGVWGNKHHVVDNDIEEPNYRYWTMFRMVKNDRPGLKTAIFSTWTDNRTKLVGEDLEATDHLKLDYAFDGLELDTVRYPHDKQASHIKAIDEAVANEAARYLRENGPDLSWVYLEYTDDMGHRYGDSPQFHDAIYAADQQVGKIWDALQVRQQSMNEDWLLIVTTDHGRDAATGKNHGGQSDRERLTWIVTNARGLNSEFKELPSAVDILPTIIRHLGVKVPEDVRFELDGTSLTGEVDFSHATAKIENGKLTVQWKDLSSKKAQVEIWLSPTNHFGRGERDVYTKIATVSSGLGRYSAPIQSTSKVFKVVVKSQQTFKSLELRVKN